jgi:hypothetical protein
MPGPSVDVRGDRSQSVGECRADSRRARIKLCDRSLKSKAVSEVSGDLWWRWAWLCSSSTRNLSHFSQRCVVQRADAHKEEAGDEGEGDGSGLLGGGIVQRLDAFGDDDGQGCPEEKADAVQREGLLLGLRHLDHQRQLADYDGADEHADRHDQEGKQRHC